MRDEEFQKRFKELEELARPLAEFIRRNYNPHTTIIVTDEFVKVVIDEMGTPINNG